jgi:hypothetical protein
MEEDKRGDKEDQVGGSGCVHRQDDDLDREDGRACPI